MNAAELHSRLVALGIDIVADSGQLRVSAARGRLTPELQTAIAEHRADLLKMLNGRTAAPTPWPEAAPRLPPGAALPLSFFQERLWVLQRLDPTSTAYNMVVPWLDNDRYDAAELAAAIRDVVERHEILRSTFRDEDDVLQIQVLPTEAVPIETHHVGDLDEAEGKRLIVAAIKNAAHRPFDLTTEPPVRFAVYDSAAGRTMILLAAHHIALDAWSIALLHNEILDACRRLSGAAAPNPAAALQYADFAAWQRRTSDPRQIASQLAWWESRLSGSPQLCLFPPDQPPGESDTPGDVYSFSWSTELSEGIRVLARTEGATVYMAMIAACSAVLNAHTGQNDIVLGSPMGTRERAEFETIIGPFVNLLVLRLGLDQDRTFAEVLRSARDAVLDAHAHREVPFELLIERLKPVRTFNHPPLFQVAVVLHNATAEPGVPIQSGGAMHDLTWFAGDTGGQIWSSIEYRSDLYGREAIARIAGHLETVLAAAVADRHVRIGNISLLSAAERHCVTETFNATAIEIEQATVPVQIERQVARSPDACALCFAGAELSYAALNRRANQLARHLGSLGIGPGALVGICLERSLDLVVALLGIQKSGAAYVPLDPAFPPERLAFMLADSGVALVVTSAATAASLEVADGVRLFDLAAAGVTLDALDATDLPAAASANDLAYVIYTSGSLGQPKGVKISHAALANVLGSMLREPGLSACDVLAAVTTVSFDIAGLELYLPLLAGARIELLARETVTDGAALATQLEASGATVLQVTPVTLRQLVDAGWQGRSELRVLCGGEALPPDLAVALHGRVAELWNLYGPTETTIWSTVGRIEPGASISIGRPIANTRVYVVGRNGEPVAIGMPGEIWIGGSGVAMGYHARPELTAERFVPDRFSSLPGARLYRTGDLGRWGADGRLYHLGRIDHQVKIRGFRIELGEIEAVLRSHPAVSQAVVVGRDVGTRPGDLRLVAYVVYRTGEDLTATEVRHYLRQRLPDVMVPSVVMALDSVPVTPNGKVDRKALPDPFRNAGRTTTYEPPAPGPETEIAKIWQRILKVDRIGAQDNFFELGGHSLLTLAVAAAVQKETGWRMDPRSLFFQNLRQIVTVMRRDEAGAGNIS